MPNNPLTTKIKKCNWFSHNFSKWIITERSIIYEYVLRQGLKFEIGYAFFQERECIDCGYKQHVVTEQKI